MTIEKLDGTSPRLYTLVAPLVMRRSVLRQNNNYPFWTSRAHTWFVAWEGETVFGFVPVEITDGGVAKINNYYVCLLYTSAFNPGWTPSPTAVRRVTRDMSG